MDFCKDSDFCGRTCNGGTFEEQEGARSSYKKGAKKVFW